MKQLYGLVGRQVVLVIILIFTISEIYGQGADKKDTVKLEQKDTFEIIKIRKITVAKKKLQKAIDNLQEIKTKNKLDASDPLQTKVNKQANINKAENEFAKSAAENELAENQDKIKFGNNVRVFVSVGPTLSFEKLYDPILSPVDSSLRLQTLFPVSLILSTGVVVSAKSRKAELIKSSNGSIDASNYYRKPSLLSFIANVNLAQFSSAASSFNQKITGGVGMGIRASEDFYVGITYDINMTRQLRDFYIDNYQDKQILLGSTKESDVLGNLDSSNNQFFYDKYYGGLSIKFVYVVTGKKVE